MSFKALGYVFKERFLERGHVLIPSGQRKLPFQLHSEGASLDEFCLVYFCIPSNWLKA